MLPLVACLTAVKVDSNETNVSPGASVVYNPAQFAIPTRTDLDTQLILGAVIFGAGAVQSMLDGLPDGALMFLAAFSVGATLLSPFAAAAAVRLNLAG